MHRKATILLVDDDSDFRTLMKDVMEKVCPDAVIHQACGADEALDRLLCPGDLAESEPVDLVCLDLEMPGMDGQELLKIIKSHDALGGIAVLMLTGRDNKDQRLLAAANGADGYAIKSSDPDVLFQIAREAARRWLRPEGSLGACGTAPRWIVNDGGTTER
ncbi:MAG: response regulator [Planctomycetes bacterium]|nr:response regulator [Planctomycetota bacterium]